MSYFAAVKNKLAIFCPNSLILVRALFVLLVLSLFLNPRYAFISDFSYILGEKKDFTIIFLNISDIILFLLLISVIILRFRIQSISSTWKEAGPRVFISAFIIFLAAGSYLFQFNKITIPILSIYYLLLLTKGIVLHETILFIRREFFRLFLPVFLCCLALTSLLSIYQFAMQHDLGLQIFGESIIGPYIWGVAKVEALGQVFSRSYGIFPHPNIFGAFLTLGILCSFGFVLEKAKEGKAVVYLAGVFLINLFIFALFTTFSRAAWAATGIGIALSLFFTWNHRINIGIKRYYLIFLSTLVSIFVISILIFPLIRQRGNVFDKAYQERKSYNQAAIEMINKHPVIGLGPGESLIHMEQSLGASVEPWEVQPIHNYYLLLAAEIGLPALLLFLWYISYGVAVARRLKKFPGFKIISLGVGCVACLVLMLFDHYFYTFQPTILLFWLWTALFFAEVAHETNHRYTDATDVTDQTLGIHNEQ